MKSTCPVLLTLALASTAIAGPMETTPPPPPPPLAPNNAGFYIGAEGGLFWLQDRNFGIGDFGFGGSGSISYKTGWGVSMPVGYNFGNGLSIGVSSGFFEANVKGISVQGTPLNLGYYGISARTEFVPIMAEASYDVHLVGALWWDIGAGIGAGYTRDSVSVFGFSGYAADWSFAFEGTTGLSYRLCPNAVLRLGYRYMNAGESGVGTDRLGGHALELGFKVNF